MRAILLSAALAVLALPACRQQAPAVPETAGTPESANVPETRPSASPESPPASGEGTLPPASGAPATPSAPDAPAADRSQVNTRIDAVLGDHARYEKVIDALQKAVADEDAAAVAALVHYPFGATIDGRTVKIPDARAFAAKYDKIVTPRIAGVVVAQKYPDLFVNDKGIMFGDGEVWINGICKDDACRQIDVRVVAIQSTK